MPHWSLSLRRPWLRCINLTIAVTSVEEIGDPRSNGLSWPCVSGPSRTGFFDAFV